MSKKPGDWDCASCDHLNFSRRDVCQRCSALRPLDGGGGGRRSDYSSRGGAYFGSPGYGSSGRNYGSSFPHSNGGDGDVRPGDWYCVECNAHNFASRTGCFKCGAHRDDASEGRGSSYDSLSRSSSGYGFGSSAGGGNGSVAAAAARSGWKSGDWICSRSGCNVHNFASRLECFRCNAPREPGI